MTDHERDPDGLVDFADEEKRGLNFDPEDGDDGDDDVDLRELLLHEEDYEGEEDAGDETGEGGSVEDDQPEDQSFKNEENARNAERRRQEEALRTQQVLQQSQEYQLVQRLAQMSGKTPAQMMAEIEEAQIRQQAQAQGVPLELYRRTHQAEQTAQAVQTQLQQLQFENWNHRVDQEAARLKSELPMLDDNDLFQAKTYILQTLQNTDVSLEQAVYALHSKKIIEAQREQERTETLAEVSGRKKSSAAPLKQSAAKAPNNGLTAAERAAARALGMSAAEYAKYR